MKQFKYSILSLSLFFVFAGYFTPITVLSATIDLGEEGGWQNIIKAHDAGFTKVSDTYYWFGSDRSEIYGGWNAKSINCYSSNDLANWTFQKKVFQVDPQGNLSIRRPKVIYHETTGKYVMWMGAYGVNGNEALVAVSETICGEYTIVDRGQDEQGQNKPNPFKPFGNESGDSTLFKDDVIEGNDINKAAYFISVASSITTGMDRKKINAYKLRDDDYLDVVEYETIYQTDYSGTCNPDGNPDACREAPAVIKKDGTYYLLTSGTNFWYFSQQKYATATSLFLNYQYWSAMQNVGDCSCYDSQTTYIITVEGTQDTSYIYCGDRWNFPCPSPYDYPEYNCQGGFGWYPPGDWDMGLAPYIWMPLEVNSGTMTLKWNERWTIDVTTGVIVTEPYSISGRVLAQEETEEDEEIPLPETILYLRTGGQAIDTTVTDSEGKYKFEDVASNPYFVVPEKCGFAFNPPWHWRGVTDHDWANVNFTVSSCTKCHANCLP